MDGWDKFGAVLALIFFLLLSILMAIPRLNAMGKDPPIVPDKALTPGAVNHLITQASIPQTICNPRWSTKSVRPAEDYTDALKVKQLNERDYDNKDPMYYEEDHLIPLELGGHPSDPRNLWPEVWAGACGAHVKDRLEDKLHELVCAGRLGLDEARNEIATDWIRSYQAHVGPLSCP